ncbi:peptide chain release factor 1 [Spiroplasma endosymbiont of Amphibalanus improvisus]|uniref:peptide chain release factor 1 n=1 Tax=Spiroplasma endosymbiont of Amphibalanus improvisus TaxID=3066327 RepID=UPI00313E9FE5
MNQKTIERLEAILERFNEIENKLTTEEIINDIAKMTELMKEKSKIEELANLYSKYKNYKNNIAEAKEMQKSSDPDWILLAKEEIKNSEEEILKIETEVKIKLLPKDPNDSKNVIVEIHGAAGGDEGNIFAGDLFKMYSRYSEIQKWTLDVLEAREAEHSGFSSIVFSLKGKNVYSKMKFESGAHRVQRIPKTESKGRVHTSTATVAVLPKVEDVEVDIKVTDLKIDTYRSSGAGGQHVNTTDSAVRITHIPTGIVVTSQDGRSQHSNKALAMEHLKSKIYESELKVQNEKLGKLRKQAVGTGDRSEKIRTYNYPQNRVTDHRIGLTLNKLDYIMNGNIEELIAALINEEQRLKMEGVIED